MRTTALSVLAAALVLALSGRAAATTYDFGYTAQTGFETASGSFTTGPGGLVTSISGFTDGPAGYPGTITGLSTYELADNMVSSTPPYVDFDGLAFTSSAGVSYNLFSFQGNDYVFDSVAMVGTPVTLDVVAVPEPSIWALMLAGLMIAGRRLRQANTMTRRPTGAIVAS